MGADYSTVGDRSRKVLGAEPHLTLVEMAAKAGTDVESAKRFWRTLGLPLPDDDDVAFTEADVHALTLDEEIRRYGVMSPQTESSVLRAIAHSCERLAWWQVEALVDDAGRRFDLDEVSARMVVLDHIGDVTDVFEEQAVYAWRRHMVNIFSRFDTDTTDSSPDAVGTLSLPLLRAVGFADLVEYMAATADMDATELADLVQRFEWTVRDVVAIGGGRVIKTIGDAVMFVADDAARGAAIALELAERIRDDAYRPGARVGMIWGRVLARFGDIFGPPVNLASRLTNQAMPGQVLTDRETANELRDEGRFDLLDLEPREVPGVGKFSPVLVSWSAEAAKRATGHAANLPAGDEALRATVAEVPEDSWRPRGATGVL